MLPHQTQSAVQVVAKINMNVLPIARESERPLQRETNRSFENPVSLSPFLDTHIALQKLHFGESQLKSSSWRPRSGEQGSDNCWRALANNYRIWWSHAREARIQPQGALILFGSCHQRAEIRRLCNLLGSAKPHLIDCANNFALLETCWHPARRNSELLPLIINA